jgi:hypothetical protein
MHHHHYFVYRGLFFFIHIFTDTWDVAPAREPLDSSFSLNCCLLPISVHIIMIIEE